MEFQTKQEPCFKCMEGKVEKCTSCNKYKNCLCKETFNEIQYTLCSECVLGSYLCTCKVTNESKIANESKTITKQQVKKNIKKKT